MKLGSAARLRLDAAAEIRRQLGDREATITVDGVTLDDAEVRLRVAEQTRSEERALQAALEHLRDRSGAAGRARQGWAKLRDEVAEVVGRLKQGPDAYEQSVTGHLTVGGVDLGSVAAKALGTSASEVRHTAVVELKLHDGSVGRFEVDVVDAAARATLRAMVTTAAGVASLPSFIMWPGFTLAGLGATSALLAVASLAPAAAGNRELRDGILRTAAKVLGLGVMGEIDATRLSALVAVATELKHLGEPAATVRDVSALHHFLDGGAATTTAPPEAPAVDVSPAAAPGPTASTREPLGWAVHETPAAQGPTLAELQALASVAPPPSRLDPARAARVRGQTVAERGEIERTVSAAAEHHAATDQGRRALEWALRALATARGDRPSLILTPKGTQALLEGAETSLLARLPLGLKDRLARRRGHLSDAEISALLGSTDLGALIADQQAAVSANLARRGLQGPIAEAYAAYLAGADLDPR